MKKEYLLGNHALAYGLAEGGLSASFAYPGTPSSEITEKLIELARKYNFYVEWSINEKVALENAYGVAISGYRSCAIMKQVGLNVAADPLMTSAYTGVIGGLVVVVADDPGIHSSQNEQDSRRYALFAKIPCLEPASPQEALEMAKFSFEFSEKFGLPVMLRTVTRLAHGKADVQINVTGRQVNRKSGFKKDPACFVMVPANARTAGRKLNEKQKQLLEAVEDLPYHQIQEGKSETIIVTSGLAWHYARELAFQENSHWGIIKIASYPVPEKKLKMVLADARQVLVLEEGEPVLQEIVERLSRSVNPGAEIHGKLDGFLPREGELSLELVEDAIYRLSGKVRKTSSSPVSLPVRPPVLCPGCPHRASFQILKKVFGRSAIFSGDIGCYTLGINMGAIDTCLCMGAGISMGSGIARREESRPVVAIIGDSTFFHAGIPAVINCAYNQVDLVVAILDNRTTAMTGHQPHPGTGQTAAGKKFKEINLENLCRACGADEVMTVDPYRVEETMAVVNKLKQGKGLRVVIFQQECLLLRKQESNLEVKVDTEKCRQCKLCLELGCPALEWQQDKPVISPLCAGCGVCASFCPHQAITKNEKKF